MIRTGLFFTIVVLLSLAQFSVLAQQVDSEKALTVLPAPKGNYLLMFSSLYLSEQDSTIRATTAYFSIERAEATAKLTERRATEADRSPAGTSADDLLLKSLKYREVGRLQRVATEQDMRRLVSDEYITALRKATDKQTNAQLADDLYRQSSIYEFSYRPGDTELPRLLGIMYLDADVKPDVLYFYRVIRVTADGQKQPWGNATTVSGVSNEILNGLQIRANSLYAQDSLVLMRWKVPVSQFDARKKPERPARMSPADSTFRRYITNHVISPQLVLGQVMLYNGTDWKTEAVITPSLDEKGDSLVFSWQKRCVPEEAVRAFVVPQDIVGNLGTPSDTITGVAVSEGHIKLIYGITARDTVDAIRISWAKLPEMPYYTGIEVARDNGRETESPFTVLAQLTPQDTLFYDFKVSPGVNYTYQVRPIFIPLQGLVQSIPAEALGTSTKFSKPLPVSGLEISNEGRNIRVSWKGTESQSLFGYYLYRGTSKDNLSLLSGTLLPTVTTYLDTSDVLSGRTEYFYSVMSMNLRQDTSTLAPPVSIRPLRSIETTYPKSVDATLVNRTAVLSWNDVREQDNILTGFVLQKRVQPDGPYNALSATPLTEPSYTDTTLRVGQTVFYRVAAITAFGDTTTFSEATKLTVPRPAPDPVFTFNARNTTQGIEVSWPGAANGLREKYGIYRREAESDEFDKVGEVDQKSTLFVDSEVKSGIKYVYSVTAIEAEDRESKRVKSVAITRD